MPRNLLAFIIEILMVQHVVSTSLDWYYNQIVDLMDLLDL